MMPMKKYFAFLVLAGFVFAALADAQPAMTLQSVFVEGRLPTTDPESALWSNAVAVEVPLSAQQSSEPMRSVLSSPRISVKTLNSRDEIAFLLSWDDKTKNDASTKTEEFRDAVALLFASDTKTGICMGSRGQKSHIVQWKADWQYDIEEGFRDVERSFPNFWVDMYPFAVGEPPYTVPEAWPGEAKKLLVGWSVGNPMSQPLKVTPVEDAVAEGFGSVATQKTQNAIGRGVWKNDKWNVVIARKLDTKDADDLKILEGGKFNLALAAWDGSSGDRGARKSVSSWVAAQTTKGGMPPYLLQGAVLVVFLAAGIIYLSRGVK